MCKDCSAALSASNSRYTDGLLCKPCKSKRQCAWQKSPERNAIIAEYQRKYNATNRENIAVYRKARYARIIADPITALARKTKSDAWNSAHSVELRQRRKARYAANSPLYVAQSVEWAKKNPDKAKANRANHRALKRGGTLTGAEWRGIVESFNHACAYCLRMDRKLTMDHVTALSRGGIHEASNVVPACQSCNSSKRQRGILVMLNRNQCLSRAEVQRRSSSGTLQN